MPRRWRRSVTACRQQPSCCARRRSGMVPSRWSVLAVVKSLLVMRGAESERKRLSATGERSLRNGWTIWPKSPLFQAMEDPSQQFMHNRLLHKSPAHSAAELQPKRFGWWREFATPLCQGCWRSPSGVTLRFCHRCPRNLRSTRPSAGEHYRGIYGNRLIGPGVHPRTIGLPFLTPDLGRTTGTQSIAVYSKKAPPNKGSAFEDKRQRQPLRLLSNRYLRTEKPNAPSPVTRAIATEDGSGTTCCQS